MQWHFSSTHHFAATFFFHNVMSTYETSFDFFICWFVIQQVSTDKMNLWMMSCLWVVTLVVVSANKIDLNNVIDLHYKPHLEQRSVVEAKHDEHDISMEQVMMVWFIRH